DGMVRSWSYGGLLVRARVGALGPASPSRAAGACEFVAVAELERAFGIPFGNRYSSKIDNYTDDCVNGGREVPVMVNIVNATLPPGSELTDWRAQRKANMQGLCEEGAPNGMMGKGTIEMEAEFDEGAYRGRLGRL